MARKKTRKFARGGEIEVADDIVVKGKRAPSVMEELSNFNLSRIGGGVGMGGGLGTGMVGGAGMGQRLAPMGSAPMPASNRMPVTPAVVRQAPSALGNIMGDKGAKGYGVRGSFRFKEGGKADGEPTGGKKRTKAKKYATGGKVSAASKRADGCATKGKTKGRFV